MNHLCYTFAAVILCAASAYSFGYVDDCPRKIIDNCQINEYFLSTLEIIDRELRLDRQKADGYFVRQICQNSKEYLDQFRKCVVTKVHPKCWQWGGAFDEIYTMTQEYRHIKRALVRYDEVFVIIQHNLCENEYLRHDYLDIRSCTYRRYDDFYTGDNFKAYMGKCVDNPDYPSKFQNVMDRMGMCVGQNRAYGCYLDYVLESCGQVRKALIELANSAGAITNPKEMELVTFILQTAHSDNIYLPKAHQCDLFVNGFYMPRSKSTGFLSAVIVLFLLVSTSLVLYWYRDEVSRFLYIFVERY